LREGPDGRLDPLELDGLIDQRTRLVSIAQVSNVTGAIQPIARLIEVARARQVPVAIDAAQSVAHLPTDVVALGCDFLAFSGHKMLAPSGIGVLYARRPWGERLRPLKLGGGTVLSVQAGAYELKPAPSRFEAGTPNIEGAIGLAAAIGYLERIGMERVREHSSHLARAIAAECETLRAFASLLGPSDPEHKVGLAALVPRVPHWSPDLLATVLSDSFNVMARSGTHCAHPYFRARALDGALRLSTGVYTAEEDLARAFAALREILRSEKKTPRSSSA
jgi:cysteine desulfurase/selenocysteine lyase